MTLATFVTKWTHPDYPPERVESGALDAAQAAFGIRFPVDYVAQVLETGLPRPTIALLDAIVERDLNLDPVSDFFAPDQIESSTTGWREAGLPDYFVAFASDCSGNLFCFHATEPGIWFFDHDFGTTQVIASTFSVWVDTQVAIEPVPES
jgi:hypothetical protein